MHFFQEYNEEGGKQLWRLEMMLRDKINTFEWLKIGQYKEQKNFNWRETYIYAFMGAFYI